MNESAPQTSPSVSPPDRRSVVAVVLIIAILIPLPILAEGYLPGDDALRHAAKAVSGKSWDEVLLLRPGLVDFAPGWHAILTGVHKLTGASAMTVLMFEVAFLFALFSVGPAFLMRRPEAWLVALSLVALLEVHFMARMTLGRPLILTMAAIVVICLVWRRLDGDRLPRGAFLGVATLIAASSWIHGAWFLWALPVVAFAVTAPWRVTLRLAGATAAGVLVAALLTGNPIRFLWQTTQHVLGIFGSSGITNFVGELRPYPGAPQLVLLAIAVVIGRKVWRGEPARTLRHDPVFALALLGWALGLRSARFWLDWGMPAFIVWLALEIESLWIAFGPARQRLAYAGAAAVACFLVLSGNANDRWNNPNLDPAYRAMLRPENVTTLPDSGGILYSNDKRVFYDLFFLRPDAPWRYSTGFTPELMPPEDLAVYSAAYVGTPDALEPWARKLRRQDRLVFKDDRGVPPWRWLEWRDIGHNVWVGRLPR